MDGFKLLGSVLGLSLLFGTGVFAEILEGEPGTSKNPKDNVPEQIQRDSDSLHEDSPSSGPGERSDSLTGLKHEKPVPQDHEALQKNVDKTNAGGAAMAAGNLNRRRTYLLKARQSHSINNHSKFMKFSSKRFCR